MSRASRSSPARAARLRAVIERRNRQKLYVLAMELEVHASTVSRWLQGAPIHIDHAERLCATLDVSLDWLLLGRGGPESGTRIYLSEVEERLVRHARGAAPEIIEAVVELLRRLSDLRRHDAARSTKDTDIS